MATNYDLVWAREHAGLTQQQLADELNVTRFTVTRWETGKTPMPKVKWARALKLLKLTASDIPTTPAVPERKRPAWMKTTLRLVPSEEFTSEEMEAVLLSQMPPGAAIPEDDLLARVDELLDTHDMELALLELVDQGVVAVSDTGMVTRTGLDMA